eukprot:7406905-Lingulodinium_polyedra.AAC.1
MGRMARKAFGAVLKDWRRCIVCDAPRCLARRRFGLRTRQPSRGPGKPGGVALSVSRAQGSANSNA